MARPARPGLDYFPRDIDIHSNRKMRRLMNEFGLPGFVVYDYLLCEIYRGQGYWMKWDKELAFDIADSLHGSVTEDTVHDIIAACLRLELLDQHQYDRNGILTSAGIQQRYVKAKKSAKVSSQFAVGSLQSADEEGKNDGELSTSPNPCLPQAGLPAKEGNDAGAPPPCMRRGMPKTGGGDVPECGKGEHINWEETGVMAEETRVLEEEMPRKHTLSTQSKGKKSKEEESKGEMREEKRPRLRPRLSRDRRDQLSWQEVDAESSEVSTSPNPCLPQAGLPAEEGKAVSTSGQPTEHGQLQTGNCTLSPPPAGMQPIDVCREAYLSPAFVMAREQLCMNRGMTMERLLEWIDAFHLVLREQGEEWKTMEDYAKHFRNWLKYQPVGSLQLAVGPGRAGTSEAGRKGMLNRSRGQPMWEKSGVPMKGAEELLRERERRRGSSQEQKQ